jgi:hypothetical protein
LFRAQDETIYRTTTEDLSSSGFSCTVSDPYTPGETVTCDIVMPAHTPHRQSDLLYVRCSARVVRVTAKPCGGYTLACRIEEYSILHPNAVKMARERPET